MRVIGTKSSEDNLCKYCNKDFPTCPKVEHIKFGDGLGNDNIIECSECVPKHYFNVYPIKGMPELGIFKRGDNK